MNIENVRCWIQVIDAMIASMTFGVVLSIALTSQPQKLLLRTFEEIGRNLKKSRNRFLDYDKLNHFLIRNGADYHLGKWVNPINYTAIRLILCGIGLLLGSFYAMWSGLVIAVLFFVLPDILLIWLNGKDNEHMIPELKLVYSSISMQIKSGVHVTDALSECYGSVSKGRLREALHTLSSDIVMNADVEGALEQLRDKFDNRYVEALCIIVLQALESGQALDLLSDIAEQIKDMEGAIMNKKKSSLDRSITFYQLGILAAILAIVLYACVVYMMTTAMNF